MRILGIIPARGGSKGVPGKNIKPLNGKPLLAYTAETALACELLSEVILSTDDPEIYSIGKSLGLNVPFTRPAELAQDNTPSVDVIVHALEWFAQNNQRFDAVCLLQVTSPFRTADFLDTAIGKFIESAADSLISVQKVPQEYNPHWAFEMASDGNLRIATGESQIITRRQDLPEAYHRDGNIYITKSEVIMIQRSLYGDSIAFIESDPELYVNIDTPDDWARAEQIARKLS